MKLALDIRQYLRLYSLLLENGSTRTQTQFENSRSGDSGLKQWGHIA